MAQKLFWETISALERQHTFKVKTRNFHVKSRRFKGIPRRIKKTIHAVDSTTIRLVVSNIDWAKHRRRKAGLKCHLRLDLQSCLPGFVHISPARENDAVHAAAACCGLKAGEIALFDRAYLDVRHLRALHQRGVFWVTRTKTSTRFRVLKTRAIKNAAAVTGITILADEEVEPELEASRKLYPCKPRRVHALLCRVFRRNG
jgi:hypothetical protein